MISFERALRSKNLECIITGKGLDRLKGKSPMVTNLKEGLPLSFVRINNFIKKELGCLEYIDFWCEVEIEKVVY